jgi:hypothetical protein
MHLFKLAFIFIGANSLPQNKLQIDIPPTPKVPIDIPPTINPQFRPVDIPSSGQIPPKQPIDIPPPPLPNAVIDDWMTCVGNLSQCNDGFTCCVGKDDLIENKFTCRFKGFCNSDTV